MTELVEWLWQGLVLVFVGAVALRVSRRLDAASRYAIWWGVLLAVLALPFIPAIATERVIHATNSMSAAVARPGSTPLAMPPPPDWLVAVVVGAWLGSVVLGLCRLAYGMASAWRLRRLSLEVAGTLQRRLPMWMATRGSRRAISLRHSAGIRSACVAGGPRPAIVLPSDWLDTLNLDALDQVVIHEQAHLDRFDDVARVIEAVIECFAGWHPAVRFALARLDIEREAACDDRVVLRTGEAARYASCLADAAATVHGGALEPQLLPRVFGRVSALQVRVARVLDGSRSRRARLRPAVVTSGVVLLSVSVLAAGQLDPILVFEQRQVAARFSPSALTRPEAPLLGALPSVMGEPTAVTSRIPPRPSRRVARPHTGTAPLALASEQAPEADAAPIATPTGSQSSMTVLTSRTLDVTFHPPAALPPRGPVDTDHASPWTWSTAAQGGVALANAAGRGGVAVGTSSKKAGAAIGGFFARAGRAVGKNF